jgi:hypothetical protein
MKTGSQFNSKLIMKIKAALFGLAIPILLGQRTNRTIMTRMSGCAVVVLSCWLTAFQAWSDDCVLPPAGFVAWWSAEGSANDLVGTNNGTLRGGATFASGEVGQAFDFDGLSGSVLIPDAPALRFTNAMTIEVWINPRSSGGTPREIVSKWFGNGNGHQNLSYTTSIDTSGQAYILVSSDGDTSNPDVDYKVVYTTSIIPLNQWSHFAATYDGASLKVYLNGVLENQASWTNGIFPGTAPLVIGECYSESLFNGLIDEPSLYNRALSDTEIQEIYNAGGAGKCHVPVITSQPQSQVGYWGKSVTFSVGAVGGLPLSYQWLKDGNPIGNAFGSSLVLTNLQVTDAGNYSVVVTGSVGSTTSSNAYLTMNPAGVSLALYSGITIDGVVGLTYGIQYNTDVSITNGWRGMANVTLGTPTQLWFDVQPASQARRYYRVVPGPISVP